jgi:hypothetical protein
MSESVTDPKGWKGSRLEFRYRSLPSLAFLNINSVYIFITDYECNVSVAFSLH